MREIKFRAWDKELRTMQTGTNQYRSEELDSGFRKSSAGAFTRLWNALARFKESDDFVLMQYTSLKDKNGKEIYEGDIVTSEFYPYQDEGKYNYHGIIEWEEGSFCITKKLVNKGRAGISDGICMTFEGSEYFEVIGNIYENPELLEEV